MIEAPYPLVVDHINHNGIDNRKANLRAVTQAQNILNRVHKKRPNSHSRYRGVSRHIRRNKWAVQICYNGRHKTVGYFQNEIEAAKAYDEAARKYHKEFAVLNFDE
ncbi:MAG: AP2 domain-containing protein [Planctomycetota bacterium]